MSKENTLSIHDYMNTTIISFNIVLLYFFLVVALIDVSG